MKQAEEKRLGVEEKMIQDTSLLMKEARVPGPRNPRAKDENHPADYQCLVCGDSWSGIYQSDAERTCPACRSNSVRWIRKR
jgi:rubrerythrin